MPGTRLQLAAAIAAMGILAVPAAASAAGGPVARKAPVPGLSALSDVACPTARACVAVGWDTKFDGKSAVINAATGAVTVWSGDLAGDWLHAVACPGTTSCLAVADHAVASVTVASGAMTVTATPKPVLGAIACAGPRICYGAGLEALRRGGSAAAVVRLSAAGKLLATKTNSGTGIHAIACPSASLCLMGEHYHSGEVIQLLRNGKFGTSHALSHIYIDAISCYQAALCYALGTNRAPPPPYAPDEVLPLNPATGVPGPVTRIGNFVGDGLTCINATTCLVSGRTLRGASKVDEVVAVVNGKLRKPASYPGDGGLREVACASASACYAVGFQRSGAIMDKVKS